MIKYLAVTGLLALLADGTYACNPELAQGLLPSDPEFLEAANTFADASANKYARLAAYESMLRVDGAAFGAVLRDGYLSDETDIVNAATFCDVMRSNGAVARVTGLPENSGLSDKQKAQVLTYSFNLKKAGEDWSQGCLSTSKHPSKGCNPTFFISVRDGTISFRSDYQTGTFRRVDGEFVGTIELRYGGPVYTVPAKLTLQ